MQRLPLKMWLKNVASDCGSITQRIKNGLHFYFILACCFSFFFIYLTPIHASFPSSNGTEPVFCVNEGAPYETCTYKDTDGNYYQEALIYGQQFSYVYVQKTDTLPPYHEDTLKDYPYYFVVYGMNNGVAPLNIGGKVNNYPMRNTQIFYSKVPFRIDPSGTRIYIYPDVKTGYFSGSWQALGSSSNAYSFSVKDLSYSMQSINHEIEGFPLPQPPDQTPEEELGEMWTVLYNLIAQNVLVIVGIVGVLLIALWISLRLLVRCFRIFSTPLKNSRR